MVALLSLSGLPAEKLAGKDNLYSVATSKNAFAQAVGILRSNGFPREHYVTLGDVFAKESFVSSPLEERARLNYALSQEIAHTIASVEGVLKARVHLAVPPRDDLNDKVLPASASVFIKHRADVDLRESVGLFKALVVNGIENLAYEDVTVALFETNTSITTSKPANIQLSANVPPKTMKLNLFSGVSLGAFALLLLVFVLSMVVLTHLRKRRESFSKSLSRQEHQAD